MKSKQHKSKFSTNAKIMWKILATCAIVGANKHKNSPKRISVGKQGELAFGLLTKK